MRSRVSIACFAALCALTKAAGATPPLRDGQTYGVPSPDAPTSLSVTRATIALTLTDHGAEDVETYDVANESGDAQTASLASSFTVPSGLASPVTATLDRAPIPVALEASAGAGVARVSVTVPPHATATLVLRHAHGGGDRFENDVAPRDRFHFLVTPERWASFSAVDVTIAAPDGCEVVTSLPRPGNGAVHVIRGQIDVVVRDRRPLWFGWIHQDPYFCVVLGAVVLSVVVTGVGIGRLAKKLGTPWKRGLVHLVGAGGAGMAAAALAASGVASRMPDNALGATYGIVTLALVALAWPVAALVSFAATLPARRAERAEAPIEG